MTCILRSHKPASEAEGAGHLGSSDTTTSSIGLGFPMAMAVDSKTYPDQALELLRNLPIFTMRHWTQLHLDRATVIWDGSVVTGLEALTDLSEV